MLMSLPAVMIAKQAKLFVKLNGRYAIRQNIGDSVGLAGIQVDQDRLSVGRLAVLCRERIARFFDGFHNRNLSETVSVTGCLRGPSSGWPGVCPAR